MKLNLKGISALTSLCGAILSLVTLIVFCIYGVVYDYFDTVVCICLAAGAICFFVYLVINNKVGEIFNLIAVFAVIFGMGLFFLNSYPVWADRLNNISMYGSRGTLVPVVIIMVLCLVSAVLGIISCFTRKEADA